MDLGEILRVLRNRWLIVVPMLVLAVGLGIGAFIMVPTTYSTYTMVSLLSAPAATKASATQTGQGQDNPFLYFNGSLVATADFLGRRLQSTDTVLELKSKGLTEKYEVALAENAQGPFLTLTLKGTDKPHLLASAAQLAAYAGTTLDLMQQQNGVADKDRIKLTQVIPPQTPKVETKEKLKLVIVAGGGTAAIGFILAFVVESVSRSRRRKAALAEAEPADAPIGTAASGTATATPDIEGTMVIQLPPVSPPVRPLPPKEKTSDAEKTQRIQVPPRQAAATNQATSQKESQQRRPGLSTTYQSNGERGGQNVNRVNGS